MFDSIENKWYKILTKSHTLPKGGTTILVDFRLEPTEGRITTFVRSEGNADEIGKRIAIAAITEAAPFGKWTEEMASTIGKDDEIVVTFNYE